jgi:drug/metabolite transporter superfamily protein YnfA
MTFLVWVILIGGAILEVGGDAIVRKGLRGSSVAIITLGCVMLGTYGLVVNTITWDFSKLFAVYIAVFALVSLLFGRFVFRESVPATTWIGIAVIISGALIIQFGDSWTRDM